MGLSKLERRLLANQYKIIGLLDENERSFCEKVEEALENGFSDFYEDALFGWMSSEMSAKKLPLSGTQLMFTELCNAVTKNWKTKAR